MERELHIGEVILSAVSMDIIPYMNRKSPIGLLWETGPKGWGVDVQRVSW